MDYLCMPCSYFWGRTSEKSYSTTFVNKGKRKDRDVIGPGPSCFSGSLSHSLGRPLLFKPRCHPLGGLGLHKRELIAIGVDELIVLRTIRIADGACAIRLDGIRAGEGILTSNLPVHVS